MGSAQVSLKEGVSINCAVQGSTLKTANTASKLVTAGFLLHSHSAPARPPPLTRSRASSAMAQHLLLLCRGICSVLADCRPPLLQLLLCWRCTDRPPALLPHLVSEEGGPNETGAAG